MKNKQINIWMPVAIFIGFILWGGLTISRAADYEQDKGRTYKTVNQGSINEIGYGYNSDGAGAPSNADGTGFYRIEVPVDAISDINYTKDGIWIELGNLAVGGDISGAAGLGLSWDAGDSELDVNAGDGIQISGDDVAVDVPGNDTEILFNDGDLLGADSDFTWNKATSVMTMSGGGASVVIDGANDTITATGGTLGFGDELLTTTGTITAGGTTYPAAVPAANDYLLQGDTDGSTEWVAGAAAANHTILDGSVHTDSVADAVTRGSIMYGNATPKWDELVIGPNTHVLTSDGTDIAWAAAAVATPAGADTQVQYNNSGSFGAEAGFVWVAGSDTLKIGSPSALIISSNLVVEDTANVTKSFYVGDFIHVGYSGISGDNDIGIVRFDDGDGDYVDVHAPALGASWDWTIPPDNGTNGYVMTTDGSGVTTWTAKTVDTDAKVGIDVGATPGYLGAAANDGVFRVTTTNGLTYADGGDFITLAFDADYADITANDGATNITAAELEELSDGSTTTLHGHADQGTTDDYSDISANDGATDVTGAELEELSDGSQTTLHGHANNKAITVEVPADDEDITLWFTDYALTIVQLAGVTRGLGAGVIYTIRHHTDRSNAGNEVITGGSSITSLTTGDIEESFNDATVPVDSWIWLETTVISSAPGEMAVTLSYTLD